MSCFEQTEVGGKDKIEIRSITFEVTLDPARAFLVEPIHILLVDDFAPFRTALREILQKFPQFTVVGEAGDGRAALELALSLAPQVVIMDVQMPRLGGVEATRRIKRMLPDLYVIGVSSNDDADTQTAMKTAGSSAFLSKSCSDQLPRLIGMITGTVVAHEELL